MLELLRDAAWQFAGVLLTLLGIVTTFLIYWLQRQTKELAFGLISSRRLLAVADEVSSRVTVQLDGKAVRDLHLVVYGLKNSGHRAIAPDDFERPFSLSFAEGQIVSAQILSQNPPNLDAQLNASESRVQLQPLLLNSGDHVLIQILLSASKPEASVDGRVVDVSSFTQINLHPRSARLHESALLPFSVLCASIAGAMYLLEPAKKGFVGLLGVAIFSIIFGYSGRIFEKIGASERRRINEARPASATD